MEKIIYLHKINHFVTKIRDDKVLRQMLKEQGIDGRRMSRFTQLALLGVLPFRDLILPQSSLYLASNFNSPSKFNKVFTQLMQTNVPSPLDFMANLGNSTVFQVSQFLEQQGASVFLAITEKNIGQPLELAFNDLLLGMADNVIVGWAYESCRDDDIEGSYWFVLSNQPQGAVASLRLESFRANDFNQSHFLQSIQSIFDKIEQDQDFYIQLNSHWAVKFKRE